MKLNGSQISRNYLKRLKQTVKGFKQHGITPCLAIILIGDDPRSLSYVRQKKIKGEGIGIKVFVNRQPVNVLQRELVRIIENYNQDPKVHGIVIQLPIPKHLDTDTLINLVSKNKDIDGFRKSSPFVSPIAQSVACILGFIINREMTGRTACPPLNVWLKNKKLAVIGKGRTGGGPICDYLLKMKGNLKRIDSKTKKPEKFLEQADIIISCVGKKEMVKADYLSKKVILISTGLHKEGKKLKGDYDEKKVKKIASFYTPTPGGVGPLNVACLFKNLVKAVALQSS